MVNPKEFFLFYIFTIIEKEKFEHISIDSLLSFLIIIFCALIIPMITLRIKAIPVPVVVGEILIGILLGKSGLNIISTSPWLEFLSYFGFAFLLFYSGLELDFEHIIHPNIEAKVQVQKKRHKGSTKHHWWQIRYNGLDLNHRPFFLGFILFGLVLTLSFVSILLLGIFTSSLNNIFNIRLIFDPPKPLGLIYGHYFDIIFLSLILTTTSVGIIFPVLIELGLAETDYGLKILISGIIADFASIILITTFIILYISGFALQLLLLPMIFVIAFTAFQIMKIIQKHPKFYSYLSVSETETSQVKITGSIFLLLLFVVLAELLGVEMILGAFLAGIIISLLIPHEKTRELTSKLNALGYGFTIPIFFITVGINFEVHELFSSMTSIFLLILIIIISFLIKIIPYTLYTSRYDEPEKGFYSGLLLSSRLTLLIAGASIGLEYFLIGHSIYEILILTAILTSSISPILFSRAVKRKDLAKSSESHN